MTTREKLISMHPEGDLIEAEDQAMIDDFVSSVKEWVNQGKTSTYIFYCEPEIVPKVKEALSEYIVQVSYVAYVGWVQAQISVQRKN